MENKELSSLVKKIIDKYFSENGENQRVIINDMIKSYSLNSINDISMLIDKIGDAVKSETTKQKKIVVPGAVRTEIKRNVSPYNPLFVDSDSYRKPRKIKKRYKVINQIEINEAREQRELFDKKISFLKFLKVHIQTESYFYNEAKKQSDAKISEAKEDGKNSDPRFKHIFDAIPDNEELTDLILKIIAEIDIVRSQKIQAWQSGSAAKIRLHKAKLDELISTETAKWNTKGKTIRKAKRYPYKYFYRLIYDSYESFDNEKGKKIIFSLWLKSISNAVI